MKQLEEAAQLNPEYEAAWRNLGDALVLNNQAWALATSANGRNRDGVRAVQLAETACEETHYQQTIMVGTLAAAYAEAGRFEDAIGAGQKACALAASRGETNLLEWNRRLVGRYQAHEAYHEPK